MFPWLPALPVRLSKQRELLMQLHRRQAVLMKLLPERRPTRLILRRIQQPVRFTVAEQVVVGLLWRTSRDVIRVMPETRMDSVLLFWTNHHQILVQFEVASSNL